RWTRWPIPPSPNWCSGFVNISSLRAHWTESWLDAVSFGRPRYIVLRAPGHLCRPFRFGAVVINAAPQAFVRVEIEVEGEGRAVGASAEFLVPKWFDKRPHLSPEETVTELRRSLLIAREIYL